MKMNNSVDICDYMKNSLYMNEVYLGIVSQSHMFLICFTAIIQQ